MIPMGVVLEIEELLFDTRPLRSAALHTALRDEGMICLLADVDAAHAGATAVMALDRLPGTAALDVVAHDLVLRRAGDTVRASIARELPTFNPAAREVVERIAAEFPVAVVTRAERADAEHMLEQVGLLASVRLIRSLGDVPQSAQHAVWRAAVARLHVRRGVAIAPVALLEAARAAGLRTIAVGPDTTAHGSALLSLSQLDSSFLSSFF